MLFEYGISLADKISGPAKQAQTSALALKNTLTSLAHAQSQLALAKGLGDVEGYKKYSAFVEAGKRQVYELGKASEKTGGGLASMGGGASAAAGGMGALVSACAAVQAAEIAVVVGVASVIASAARLGLQMSELRARTVTMFEALGEVPGAGEKTIGMLDELSGKLGQTRGPFVEWTKNLQAMGITDLGELREQLKATAASSALMGDTGVAKYEAITRKVKEAVDAHHGLKLAGKALEGLGLSGANAADVARQMGISLKTLEARAKAGTLDAAKFGDAWHVALIKKGTGPLGQMANSFENISKVGHEAFDHLFEGVDASPFTGQLRGLVGLLDQNSGSGRTFKTTLTGALNEVFKGLGVVTLEFKHFVQRVTIAGLQGKIALNPLISFFTHVKEAAGFATGAISGLGWALASIVPGVSQLQLLLRGVDAAKGLAAGMSEGAPAVDKAAGDLAGTADKAVAKRLEIGSPSRVMAQKGQNTATGFAGGMDRGQSAVTAASARMASAPIVAMGGGGGGGGPASTSSRSLVVHVGGIHIHAAPGGQQGTRELTESGVSLLFERLALQQGAA